MITETKVKNTGDNEQVCHNFIDDSFNDRGNRYNFSAQRIKCQDK